MEPSRALLVQLASLLGYKVIWGVDPGQNEIVVAVSHLDGKDNERVIK